MYACEYESLACPSLSEHIVVSIVMEVNNLLCEKIQHQIHASELCRKSLLLGSQAFSVTRIVKRGAGCPGVLVDPGL